MADVSFGKGGLQSKAPLAGTPLGSAIQKAKSSSNKPTTVFGGSSSYNNPDAAKKAYEEAQRLQAQREAQNKLAELAELQRQLDLKEQQDRLTNALIAREKIRQKSIIQNKNFSQRSIHRQLQNERTNITELRTATRSAKKYAPEVFKQLQDKTTSRVVYQSVSPLADKTKITPFGNSRLLVSLPNGKKFTIKNTGRVNVGAGITGGVTMVFQDGVLREVGGKNLYVEKLGKVEVRKPSTKIFSAERAARILANYTQRIATLESQLNTSGQKARFGRITNRIRNKNIKGSSASADFKSFKRDLGKAIEMSGLTIATSLLNLGIGNAQLVNGLKNDPVKTISELPSNILTAVKQDVARMSQGRASALNVALEWITISKVLGAASRGTKGAIKITGRATKKAISKIVRLRPTYVKNLEKSVIKRISKAKRELSVGKAKRVDIGTREFDRAVNVIDNLTAALAETKALRILKEYKKRGGIITEGNAKKFVNAVKDHFEKQIRRTDEYQLLTRLANENRSIAFRMIKKSKIKTASGFILRVRKKINSLARTNRVTLTTKRLLNKYKKLVRETKAKRERIIKKFRSKIKEKEQLRIAKIRRKSLRKQRLKLIKQGRKEFKKTIKYNMLKTRPLRKVTLSQLGRTNTITQVHRFVDSLFDEMQRRRKINLSDIKVRQFKNVIKKRIARAIKRGYKKEVEGFKQKMSGIIQELNKKEKQPIIKVSKIEKGRPTRRFRTIKDFESETPKGTYQEVKVGNQIMLQEVKTIQKTRQRQVQRYQVVQVQKQLLDLKPLFDYGVYSLSRVALMSALRTKQAFATTPTQKNLTRLAFDSATKQDFKTLQAIASAFGPATRVAQDVKSKILQSLRTKQTTIQKRKKKPIIKKKVISKQNKRVLSKGVQTYYVVEKIRGKFKKLYPRPLSAKDARDYLAYRIDNRLSRTGLLYPVGISKSVVNIPEKAKGYYSKVSKKLRPYKIRKGKRKIINGYIEKRKYIQDTRGEKIQAVMARKKKMTPLQRRKMIANLKKARAARMRKLKKK